MRSGGLLFDIPIWNLKADFQEIASEMVGFIKANGLPFLTVVTVIEKGDSLLKTRLRM